jgi:hypothetical protein
MVIELKYGGKKEMERKKSSYNLLALLLTCWTINIILPLFKLAMVNSAFPWGQECII